MYDMLKPSYDEIHNACREFALRIENSRPNIKAVVGIARGGLLPAVIISHMLNKPLIVVEYSSKEGKGDDKNHANVLPTMTPEQGPVLVVDDICDSGHTLNEIVYHFTKQNVETFTAVLYYKSHEKQVMNPDLTWRTIPHDAGWVFFPYERIEFLGPDPDAATRHLQNMVRT